MYHYRFYIDKEIVQNEDGLYEGGDHVRVIDIEADERGMGAARQDAEAQLAPDEVIGNSAMIVLGDEYGNDIGLHLNATGEPGRTVIRTGEDSP